MNTRIDSGVKIDQLMQFAHGSYQAALLRGERRWSGADLRGKAKKYGAHYARSRASLLGRLERFGYEVVRARAAHNKIVMTIFAGDAQ